MSSYSDLIVADGPSLYWRLGSSGTTDLSGNGRNGTGAGGITIGGATSLIDDTDTATDFDGANDRVTSSYNPFTNGTVRSFEGWGWRDTSTSIDTMLGSDSATAGNIVWLRIAASDTDVLFSTNGGTNNATWTDAWPGNTQAVHWVVVFNEATDAAALYLQGALISTQTLSIAYNASPGNFEVGAALNSGIQPWDGKLDEIAVYERGLSLSEIQSHYRVGSEAPTTYTGRIRRPVSPALRL